MSLEETFKLLTESRQVTEDIGNNVEHFHILFNMVLRIVTSIDTRLKSIETGIETINEIKIKQFINFFKSKKLRDSYNWSQNGTKCVGK
jgi:hypothetical protein